jgi:hypothetical protein
MAYIPIFYQKSDSNPPKLNTQFQFTPQGNKLIHEPFKPFAQIGEIRISDNGLRFRMAFSLLLNGSSK